MAALSEPTAAPTALRRPLLGLTISYVAGLVLASFVSLPLPWLLAGLLGAAAAGALLRRAAWAAGFIHLAVLFAGLAVLQLHQRTAPATDLARQLQRERERAGVLAVVADDPMELRNERGERTWRFPVRFEAVERAGTWWTASGRGEVRWTPGPEAPPVRYGQRWRLEGPATRLDPEPGRAPGVRFVVRGPEARLLDDGHGSWLRARCLEARRACARLLARGIEDDPEAVGVLRAFMLGYREELPERAHRAFSRTGTLHIAAISGAHVVILAGLLLVPLKALGFVQTRWIYVMGPLLVLYALGTGLAASAVRACIMACVFWSAYAVRRRPDGPTALALSALLILGAQPAQLWEAGFLLSFGVVAGLMLLVPPLSEPLLPRPRPGPLPAGRWRRFLAPVARPVVSLVAVTLAAWLASLPMTAQFFSLFSPVGLVANLLVVPLASLILLNGCLILTLGWLAPVAAEVFNHAARVLIHMLLAWVEAFHRWPGGHWFVPAPPWWWAGLWYAGLVGLARSRRVGRVLAGVGLAVLLAVSGWWAWPPARPEMAVTPLGRTVAVLADGPGRGDILVDPGSAFHSRSLVRWLHRRGVNELEAVVLTRASMEAAGALPALWSEVRVREVWLSAGVRASPALQAVLARAREAGLVVVERARGEAGRTAGGWSWQVLHPSSTGRYTQAAAGGLVLRLSRDGASVLVTGPWHPAWQEEVLAGREDLAADLHVVTGGGAESFALPAWLDQARARQRVGPRPGGEGFGLDGPSGEAGPDLAEGMSYGWRFDRMGRPGGLWMAEN